MCGLAQRESRDEQRDEAGAHDAKPSQRVQEREQGVAIRLGQLGKGIARGLGLAAVPEDRLGQVARPAVVQEEGVAADRLGQADAPQRRGAPLAPVASPSGRSSASPSPMSCSSRSV